MARGTPKMAAAARVGWKGEIKVTPEFIEKLIRAGAQTAPGFDMSSRIVRGVAWPGSSLLTGGPHYWMPPKGNLPTAWPYLDFPSPLQRDATLG